MRHDVAYVCVPSGTRNHFALDLGLDRGDVVQALDAYTDGVERTVDLGQVNDRVFVNNASLGVYAQVVQSGAYRGAKARTWGRLLPDLLGPAAAPPDLEFDGPDARRYAGLPLVLVSNNPYRLTRLARSGGRPEAGHRPARHPAARARRGRWSRGRRLRRFADCWSGRCADFEVRSTAAGAGRPGRRGADAGPAAAVRVAARARCGSGSRKAPGARRARRNAALTKSDLGALARIALGRHGGQLTQACRKSAAGAPKATATIAIRGIDGRRAATA